MGEVWYGAAKRNWGERKRAELQSALRLYAVLPYTRDLSRRWGELRATLEDAGTPLGINALWIASTSLHYDIPS